MDSVGEPSRHFSDEFDDEFPVGFQSGNHAFFGRNVLRGLIDGIDDFVKQGQSRWRRHRSIGPMLNATAGFGEGLREAEPWTGVTGVYLRRT